MTLTKSFAVFLFAMTLTGCHEWFHSDHDHDGKHQYEAWLEFVQECGLDPMNYSADCKDQAAQLAKNALEDDCPDKR